MIDDEEYNGLPDDPELAFVKLEKLYRTQMQEGVDRTESGEASLYYYTDYMNHVLAAARALRLQILDGWAIPSRQADVYAAYDAFSTEVTNYIVQTKILNGRRSGRFSVSLTPAEKKKIHHYVEQIRRLVEQSQLSTEKRDAIVEKLNALNLEVDRDRTRFEIFTDLAAGLASVSADFARDGAEPWWKWVEPIFEAIGIAKKRGEEKPSLPPPEGRKRLEPPKGRGSADDDIPF
jgi:hypothetical protein